MVRDLLDRWRPDYLIIEISTPLYRLQAKTEACEEKYKSTIRYILSLYNGILDLPQTDVIPKSECIYAIHETLCRYYAGPRVVTAMQGGIIKDIIHPNDSGKTLYAQPPDMLLGQVM